MGFLQYPPWEGQQEYKTALKGLLVLSIVSRLSPLKVLWGPRISMNIHRSAKTRRDSIN